MIAVAHAIHRINPSFATCIWIRTRWLDQSIDWFKTSMFRLLDCPSEGVWVDKNKPKSEFLRHQVWGIICLACPCDLVDLSFHFCSRSVMEEVYCSLQLQPCYSWANRCRNKWGQSLRWMFCHYYTPPVRFPAVCTHVSGIKVAFQLSEEHMFYELFKQFKVLNRGDVLVTVSGLGRPTAVSVFLWVQWSQPAVLLQRRSTQALLCFLFCFYFCTALRGCYLTHFLYLLSKHPSGLQINLTKKIDVWYNPDQQHLKYSFRLYFNMKIAPRCTTVNNQML